jgi:hypothetical protein
LALHRAVRGVGQEPEEPRFQRATGVVSLF